MDYSREDDLDTLKAVFDDPDAPVQKRNAARRAFEKIRRTMKDRKLTEMRHRLIKAQIASDEDESDKIISEIEEYSLRMGY